jgi:hypothetical protein
MASDLNFFWVLSSKSKGYHLFVTLESSLGLRSIDSCGIKNTTVIGLAVKKYLRGRHDIKYFYFAEANKLYSVRKDLDEFRRDYLIIKLAGIKQ